MNRGIDGPGHVPQGLPAQLDRPAAEGAEGKYRGAKIAQVDHHSLVQESLEELPAHQSEQVSKKLAQRTASTRSGSRLQEIMDKYLRTVPGAPSAEELKELIARLKQQANAGSQQLRQELQRFLERRQDETLDGGQAATLLALEEAFATEPGGAPVLAAIRETLAAHGEQLQTFYREQVQTYEGTHEAYKQLVGSHGEADFLASCETLLQRLGGEVQAQGRAMDGAELKVKLDALYHLEVARHTYLAFVGLLEKVSRFAA
jgi:hypothetical protein